MDKYHALLTLKALAVGKEFLIFRGIQTLHLGLRALTIGHDLRHPILVGTKICQDTISYGALGNALLTAHDMQYIDGSFDTPENAHYLDLIMSYETAINCSEVDFNLAVSIANQYAKDVPEPDYNDAEFCTMVLLHKFERPQLLIKPENKFSYAESAFILKVATDIVGDLNLTDAQSRLLNIDSRLLKKLDCDIYKVGGEILSDAQFDHLGLLASNTRMNLNAIHPHLDGFEQGTRYMDNYVKGNKSLTKLFFPA